MATIRKRNDRYHVQIRKNGYSPLTKTFTSLTVARKWAAGVEADMERRLHVTPPDNTTVGDLLEKYDREVLLKAVTPASLRRELKILSRILTIASKDWGIALPQNPVQMISLSKADKGTDKTIRSR